MKLQYFGHVIHRADSFRKDLIAGIGWMQKENGVEEDETICSISDSVDMNLSKLWETVKDKEAWRAAVHGVMKSPTQLSNWTTI